MNTQICRICHLDKSLDEFHRNKHNPSGRTYWCKQCRNAYDKAESRNKRTDIKLSVDKFLKQKPRYSRPNDGKDFKHDGYLLLKVGKHPRAMSSGFVKRAVLVMEQHLGRYLLSSEHIHHINGIRDDDRLENLILVTNSEHAKLHKLGIDIKYQPPKDMCSY
jgi:hypothetical protein